MPRNGVRWTERASWSEAELKTALNRIRGGMAGRAVAKEFGIPESTLRSRLKSGNMNGPKLGRKPIFSHEQEMYLVNNILQLNNIFYNLSAKDLRSIVYRYAASNKISNTFNHALQLAGKDWLSTFKERHPQIIIQRPNSNTSVKREIMSLYFTNLKILLTKYKFSSNRIYNVDETGVICNKLQYVFTEDNQKIPHAHEVICCFNATGEYIPPFFIFSTPNMDEKLTKNGPFNSLYTFSLNGNNDQIFLHWLKFFQYITEASCDDPVLLILDNNSSHISIEILNFCESNGIQLLSLPPNSNHLLQPLDLSFFASLKKSYSKEIEEKLILNPNEPVTVFDVAELFNNAFINDATIDNATMGFNNAGIVPFKDKTMEFIELQKNGIDIYFQD